MPRGSGKRAAEKQATAAPTKDDRAKFLCTVAEKFAPTSMQKYITTAAPYISAASLFIQFKVIPMIFEAYKFIVVYSRKAKPFYDKYHLNDLLPGLAGLIMCFFGGDFPLLIVAVECFITTSYTPVCTALDALREQYLKAEEAHKKDDDVDEDEDGIPDVQQITDGEYMTRKGLLLAKALDPEKCNDAILALNGAFVLILGAINVAFVRTLALGKAVGDAMRRTAHRLVTPRITEIIPDEYKKWTRPVVDWICTFISISIAFMLQRILSAFHSAIRGGMLFARTLLSYLDKHGYIKFKEDESYLDEIAGGSLAAFGFICQLQSGFSLFFPLNILLFPVTLLEYALQLCATFAQ